MEETECRICGSPSEGRHFSVDTCRACGAFFRRTIDKKLAYKCRNGERCDISKGLRNTCKFCRYKRCIEVGMKSELVQPNRDCSSSITRLDSSSSLDDASTPELPNQLHASPAALTPIQPPIQNAADQPLINLMIEAYNVLVEQRKSYMRTFRTADCGIGSILTGNTENTVLHIEQFSLEEHMTCFKLEIDMFGEMCMKFPIFHQLEAGQRKILFKQFWWNAVAMDRAFETVNLLGDRDDKHLVVHNRKAFNIYDVTIQESDNINLNRFSVPEIKRIFGHINVLHYEVLVLPFKLLKPSIFEFVTMIGLLLFPLDLSSTLNLTTSTRNTCLQTRENLLNSLHEYFIANGRTTYSNRLDLILHVTNAAEKVVTRVKEDMTMAKIFDTWNVDPLITDHFHFCD
ncbi:hypothetical protein L596_015780 [Steinernema carpocapsae]|uniref:Nuclear receptor domain-containing protein n=1 Tax=Steinernema carpocapsae TaxID=34508 RepID=A0A4U5NGY8_STECR|nr:hypothetical protein L596_015780 [Steinernema carpocapsae]